MAATQPSPLPLVRPRGRGVAGRRGVRLMMAPQTWPALVDVDADRLKQVFVNLLSNAIKFNTSPNPEVRLSFSVLDDLVDVRISDNGPGIPRDRLKWIFEPFHTTKGLRGTGLGLAVTKRIIDEHQGRIRVETKVGQGSAFRVFLPADLDSRHDPSATAEDNIARNRLNEL